MRVRGIRYAFGGRTLWSYVKRFDLTARTNSSFKRTLAVGTLFNKSYNAVLFRKYLIVYILITTQRRHSTSWVFHCLQIAGSNHTAVRSTNWSFICARLNVVLLLCAEPIHVYEVMRSNFENRTFFLFTHIGVIFLHYFSHLCIKFITPVSIYPLENFRHLSIQFKYSANRENLIVHMDISKNSRNFENLWIEEFLHKF